MYYNATPLHESLDITIGPPPLSERFLHRGFNYVEYILRKMVLSLGIGQDVAEFACEPRNVDYQAIRRYAIVSSCLLYSDTVHVKAKHGEM